MMSRPCRLPFYIPGPQPVTPHTVGCALRIHFFIVLGRRKADQSTGGHIGQHASVMATKKALTVSSEGLIEGQGQGSEKQQARGGVFGGGP